MDSYQRRLEAWIRVLGEQRYLLAKQYTDLGVWP